MKYRLNTNFRALRESSLNFNDQYDGRTKYMYSVKYKEYYLIDPTKYAVMKLSFFIPFSRDELVENIHEIMEYCDEFNIDFLWRKVKR